MSKLNLTPNASGTGTLTVTTPNTNSDYTLTIPAVTGTINTSGAVNEIPAGTASAPGLYFTGDTNTGIFSPGADQLTVVTGGVAAISVSSGQRSTFPTTIGVGGATPSTSGSGISFPATQSASSDANTLDDYEEGTFTPTIAFGGGTTGITYSTQSGTYTKIGNVVWITLNVTLSNKGSSSGAMQILGLPFSMSATVIPSMRIQGTTFGGQYTAVSQTTQFELQETSEAGTLSTITNSDATNSSQINLTCVHNV